MKRVLSIIIVALIALSMFAFASCSKQEEQDIPDGFVAVTNAKGEKKFRGVLKYYGDTLRNDEASKQSKLPPTPISTVFSYVNEFIELLRASNGYCEKNVRFNTIVLDNSIHSIIDNGIICNHREIPCSFQKSRRTYSLSHPWSKQPKKADPCILRDKPSRGFSLLLLR